MSSHDQKNKYINWINTVKSGSKQKFNDYFNKIKIKNINSEDLEKGLSSYIKQINNDLHNITNQIEKESNNIKIQINDLEDILK